LCYYVQRKRAYIQQRLSGHTPSHVSRAPRPGTRARAAPRDPCSRSTSSQGPAARTRSTGAEERAHRAPQIREVDARPEHAPDSPTRSRGTRGTPVRGPGRENTTGDRRALFRHEQGGRASAPLQATGNCPGNPRRPQRQKRSTTNARWKNAACPSTGVPGMRVEPVQQPEADARAWGGARSLTITYHHAG